MSFSNCNPHHLGAVGFAASIPLAATLVGGAMAGAQAAADQIAEARATMALNRLIVLEQRHIATLADADDAEAEALAACARLRIRQAEVCLRGGRRA